MSRTSEQEVKLRHEKTLSWLKGLTESQLRHLADQHDIKDTEIEIIRTQLMTILDVQKVAYAS